MGFRRPCFVILVVSFTCIIYILIIHVVTRRGANKKFLYNVHPPCDWPPKNLRGRRKISQAYPTFGELDSRMTFMHEGNYRPNSCEPKQKIAVIIPYRDREKQLRGFLDNVIPNLKRQNLDFTIFVAEQAAGSRFNRGMMRNVGFVEADKESHYDCYIFHDVDVIPEDDRNFYLCGNNPRHLSALMDRHQYQLLYGDLIGGIVAFRREHFWTVNGYSNQFFVWGGEDDDLRRRFRACNISIERPLMNVSHCSGLYHKKSPKAIERLEVYHSVQNMWKEDGLNDLEYKVILKERSKLFRRILVTVNESLIRKKRLSNQEAKRLAEIWYGKHRPNRKKLRMYITT